MKNPQIGWCTVYYKPSYIIIIILIIYNILWYINNLIFSALIGNIDIGDAFGADGFGGLVREKKLKF